LRFGDSPLKRMQVKKIAKQTAKIISVSRAFNASSKAGTKAGTKAGAKAKTAPGASAKGLAALKSATEAVSAVSAVKALAAEKADEKRMKKESNKVGEDPGALLLAASMRRAEMGKSDKNPLGAKAALGQTDGKGRSSLHLAIHHLKPSIVSLLIREKADPEAVDNDGNTILIEAVLAKNKEAVTELLGMKVKVDKTNNKKKTAMELCEDTAIRLILERFMVAGKLSGGDAPKAEVEEKKKGSKTLDKRKSIKPVWRVRVEQLPTNITGDILEEGLRELVSRMGAPNPLRVEVALDPITSKPKGFAHIDFLDAAAADIAVRGHSEMVCGNTIRMCKEAHK